MRTEMPPKYSLWEHERRFLVAPEAVPRLASASVWLVDDRYLDLGRLRLRRMTDAASGARVYKLCKKYGGTAAGSEPIVNIYLTEAEYAGFATLPGRDLSKRRLELTTAGMPCSVDEFSEALSGLVLCEVGAPSAAALAAIAPPAFAVCEVTGDEFFSGAQLSRLTPAALRTKLRSLGLTGGRGGVARARRG